MELFTKDVITLSDYDKVIENLQAVRRQIEADELWRGCGYCGSEEHQPNACRHNPIAVARTFVRDATVWRCLHCDEAFTAAQRNEADAHFGLAFRTIPGCVLRAMTAAGIEFKVVTDEDGQGALVFRLRPADASTIAPSPAQRPVGTRFLYGGRVHEVIGYTETLLIARDVVRRTKVELELASTVTCALPARTKL